jgi:chromosome partitioning protein
VITIVVTSQKGGVGKTMTCANLAAALADLGLAVVMVDLDPQADPSCSWALDEDAARPRIEDSLEFADADVRDALEHIPLGDGAGSLALLPTAHERLRRQTARLLAGDGRELGRLLDSLRERFDVALVDTPAGDTIFGRQAMVAAGAAIIPLLPGYHELRALTRALDVIDERADQLQTRLELLGALVLNADPRWRSTKEYGRHLAAMAAEQRLALFDTVIPRHQPVTEHARYGLPTVWLRPACTVAVSYRRLAEEVMPRLAEREARTTLTHTPTTGVIAGRAR